jgi:hypothetical protein
MNPRERVLAVLCGNRPDYVPWFGDLDYWISGQIYSHQLPEKFADEGIFQLHRDLRVGFYLQGYFPFRNVYEGVEIRTHQSGNTRKTEIICPSGTLHSVEEFLQDSCCWATKEHPIKSWRDLRVLRDWYSRTYYEPDYQKAADRYEKIGEEGIVLAYLPRSPFMEVAAVLAGIETIVNCVVEAPEEWEQTMKILEQKTDEAALIALHSPAECLMIPENLSSEMVGKNFYKKYIQEYEKRWIGRIHAEGKFSFIHMDGTLRGLIREVAHTGFRVIEAFTPAPVGDMRLDEIRSYIEKDTILWGGLPGIYFTDLISDDEFDRYVIETLQIMRSQPGFVLGVADQVPPGSRWERIKRVSELVDQHGRIEY